MSQTGDSAVCHHEVRASRINAFAVVFTSLVSVLAMLYVASRAHEAQAESLLRSDRLSAYSEYVEDIERLRLLLSNGSLMSKEDSPSGGREFFAEANVLIPELAADEKTLRMIASDVAAGKVDDVREARLRLYQEFTCNIGLLEDCPTYPRVDGETALENFHRNRDKTDELVLELILAARGEVAR